MLNHVKTFYCVPVFYCTGQAGVYCCKFSDDEQYYRCRTILVILDIFCFLQYKSQIIKRAGNSYSLSIILRLLARISLQIFAVHTFFFIVELNISFCRQNTYTGYYNIIV